MTKKIQLSHVNANGAPKMVDVGAKQATRREAAAETRVRFPPQVAATLRREHMHTAKGPVVATAIIAGVMAAKRTHELIPFCHPLAIERCDVHIEFATECELLVRCEVAISHKTGVEMEALTGASVAALTIYDMCKSLSHAIEIGPLRLLEKSGGKRDVRSGKSKSAEPHS